MGKGINLKIIDKNNFLVQKELSDINLSFFHDRNSKFADNLGWLNPMEWANEDIVENLYEIMNKIKNIASVFIVIGIGGSNNSVRALLSAIGKKSGMQVIFAGNNLSAYEVRSIIDFVSDKDYVIDCIAKNFETLEPGVAFRIFRYELEKKYGIAGSKERIICTGTEGSAFHKIALKNDYIFVPFPNNIGGRFTALSPVHLLPAVAAGADIKSFIKGAMDTAQLLHSDDTVNNIAYKYACLRNIAYQKGKKIELFSCFEPRLSALSLWWKQLFGESEGKDGKGLFPVSAVFSEELHSLGQIIQDGENIVIETFLAVENPGVSLSVPRDGINDGFDYLNGKNLEDVNKASESATIEAHSDKFPCVCLTIPEINEYYLGALFYFFEYACFISACILGVNPFDQPGVEAYKKNMFSILGK